MATPVFTSVTRGEIMLAVARRVGDCVTNGDTTTTGAANTLVDAAATGGLQRYLTDSHQAIYQKLLTVYKGTRAGDTVAVSAYTAASRTITPSPNFGGNIDTTTKWFIHERFNQRDFTEAIQAGQRLLNFDPSLGMGVMKEVVAEEIVYGNALTNGAMFRWTAGTSAAPDGWTLAGTGAAVAQDATVAIAGTYSAKVTSDGTNAAYLYQQLTPLSRWRGRNIRVYALFMADVADRASVRIGQGITSSITTIGSAVTADQANVVKWADITSAFDTAVSSAPPTSLTLQFAISAGSAVNMRCGFAFIEDPEPRDEYAIDADESLVVLDPNLYVSEPVTQTQSGALSFSRRIGPEAWQIVHSTTRRIKLNIRRGQIRNGSVIRYTGWKNHAELSAITTTWAGPIDALVDMAVALLHQSKAYSPEGAPSVAGVTSPNGPGSPKVVRAMALAQWGIRLPAGYKTVEPIQ